MTDELRCCYECGHQTTVAVAHCPECGRRVLTVKQTRRLGWGQLLIGVFLVGLVGTIAFNLAPSLLAPGVPEVDGSTFTIAPDQALLILGLFGVIIVFGLTCMISGLWQIKTGRRNKRVLYFSLGLMVLLVLTGWSARSALIG